MPHSLGQQHSRPAELEPVHASAGLRSPARASPVPWWGQSQLCLVFPLGRKGGGPWVRPWDSPGSQEGSLQSLILSKPTFQTVLHGTVPVPLPNKPPLRGLSRPPRPRLQDALQQTPVLVIDSQTLLLGNPCNLHLRVWVQRVWTHSCRLPECSSWPPCFLEIHISV